MTSTCRLTRYARQQLLQECSQRRSFSKRRNIALLEAVEKGYTYRLRRLLADGADVDYSDDDHGGSTALHLAVHEGFKETVELLIEAGSDINARAPGMGTPLHEAVRREKIDILRTLLATPGIDVEATDSTESTPLHAAAIADNPEVLTAIVAHGCRINPVNRDRSTPLHYAAWHGRAAKVRSLVDAGASCNAKNELGCIPLDLFHFALVRIDPAYVQQTSFLKSSMFWKAMVVKGK